MEPVVRCSLLALLLCLPIPALGQDRVAFNRRAPAGGPDFSQDANAIACWNFDPSNPGAGALEDICDNGNEFDLTQNGNDITSSSCATEFPGSADGDCVKFDNFTNLIVASTDPNIGDFSPAAFSIFCRNWEAEDDGNTLRPINHMDTGETVGWEIFIFGAAGSRGFFGNVDSGGEEQAGSTYDNDDVGGRDGEWTTGFTYDSGGDDQIKMYVNGCLDCGGGSCDTEPAMTTPTSARLTLGATTGNSGDYTGAFDWCVFFNDALTASEALALHNTGLLGDETDRGATCS